MKTFFLLSFCAFTILSGFAQPAEDHILLYDFEKTDPRLYAALSPGSFEEFELRIDSAFTETFSPSKDTTYYVYNNQNQFIKSTHFRTQNGAHSAYCFHYSYDQAGRQVEYLRQDLDTISGLWETTAKTITSYNANGNKSETLTQEVSSGQWVNRERVLYAYDVTNRLVEEVQQNWNPEPAPGHFINNARHYYEYNALGKTTFHSYQDWILSSGTWQPGFEVTTTYNAEGNIVFYEFKDYTGGVLSSGTRTEYFYNTAGQDEKQLSYTYNSSSWNLKWQYLRYFNSNGLLDYFERFAWNENGQAWELNSRTLYEYQNTLYPEISSTSIAQTWDDVALTWKNDYKTLTIYTDFGNVVLRESGHQFWNDTTADFEELYGFKFYYSKIFTPTDLTSPPAVVNCQFANPASPGASVTCTSLPAGETTFARLTDLAGRMLFCQKISNDGAFTMPQYLPTGLYILTLTAEQSGVIFKEKLVVK